MKYHLSSVDYYEDDQYYWFSEMEYNGFYRVDKKTQQPELVFRFPEEEEPDVRLHNMLCKAEDWFVFAPKEGKNIVLYHSLTQEIKVIPLTPVLRQGKIRYNAKMKFSSMVYHQGKVYFFPFTYPAVLILDLKTMKIRDFTLCLEKLEKHMGDPSQQKVKQYFSCALLVEDQVYLPSATTNHMVVLDLLQEKVTIFPVEALEKGFNGIAYDGTFFWLTPFWGLELVGWSPQGGSKRLLLASDSKGLNACLHPMVYKNSLIIATGTDDTLYRVNLEDMTVSPFFSLMTPLSQVTGFQKSHLMLFCCSRIVGNALHFIYSKDKGFYTFDLEKETLTVQFFPVDQMGEEIMKQKAVFCNETKYNTLMEFCEFILENTEDTEENHRKQGKEETVGAVILQATTAQSGKKEKGRK